MSTEVVDRGDNITDVDRKANEEADEAKKKADDEAAAAKAAEEAKGKKDEDEDEDDDKPNKRIRIPKARVDEITRKAREREEALQKRIEELEGETAKSKMSADFQALRAKTEELSDKYEDLLQDGKVKEAKEVRKELAELQLYMVDALAGAKASAAQREAVADIKYDMLLSQIESTHAVLNPDGDEFDEEVANEVYDTMNRLVATGVPKDRALARAVKYVVGAPAVKESKDGEALGKKRAEEARLKAIDALKKTPADLSKHGSDSDKAGGGPADAASILRMSQDDFSKLDDETKARLRGDIL